MVPFLKRLSLTFPGSTSEQISQKHLTLHLSNDHKLRYSLGLYLSLKQSSLLYLDTQCNGLNFPFGSHVSDWSLAVVPF